MGKGVSNPGPSPAVSQGLLNNENSLVAIAQQQAANGQQLFQSAFPGFQQAENFYGTLATGDPNAIARAISPATQQIASATQGARQNIMNNTPAGGTRNLALQNLDVQQGGQVGQAATGSFLNSYNALAGLAGQGVGQSISAAGTGISGFNAGNSALSNLGGLQIQGQQIQAQQKGASLGALGQLGGDAASLGGGMIAGKGAGAAAGKGGGAALDALAGLAAV